MVSTEALERRLSDVERQVRSLAVVGPTTDYQSVTQGQHIGTQITEGVISLGGGGLGPTAIIRLFDLGGYETGWLGVWVDPVTGTQYLGAWIRDLFVGGVDRLTANNVGGLTHYVATDENTSSTAYVDLTTHDEITLKINVDTKFLITYVAQVSNSGVDGILSSIVNIDGVDVAGTDASLTLLAGAVGNQVLQYVTTITVGAGTHVIKIRHKVDAGGVVGHWLNRLLKVVQAS